MLRSSGVGPCPSRLPILLSPCQLERGAEMAGPLARIAPLEAAMQFAAALRGSAHPSAGAGSARY